jgi:hypothetical protein
VCKKRVPAKDRTQHANYDCKEAREQCTGVCGLSIKRKYMVRALGGWQHDCFAYLKDKVARQKYKIKCQAESAKYFNDFHKAFCQGCPECPQAYQHLPQLPAD